MKLEALESQYRMQTLTFEAAARVARERSEEWGGETGALAAQLVSFAENFIRSSVRVRPKLPPGEDNERKRRLLIGLNFGRILRHFADLVESENAEDARVVLDLRPTGSTGEMRPWFTGRHCVETRHSHINCCPCDSMAEAVAAEALDRMEGVSAWAKNDHLGFEIFWSDGGVARKYRPDFLVELRDGRKLILEIKGTPLIAEMEDERAAKKRAAERWVKAVNNHGKFGRWLFRQAESPDAAEEIIAALCG